ncbi:hypothetical protein E2542_SST20591 [Spatholobus suberectus]|nr:hypothetical protein E2542_SST20591 [Spatholobus suberectus]
MGCRSFSYNSLFPSLLRVAKSHWLPLSQTSKVFYDLGPSVLRNCCNSGSLVNFQALRSYARDACKGYDLFGRGRPGMKSSRKPGQRKWMKITLYGQEVRMKVMKKWVQRVILIRR